MEWPPEESAVVAQVATPAEIVAAPQLAIDEPPSRKSTVPVGAPELPDTVSVKVTLWLGSEGFTDETREVVESALSAWLTVFDVAVVYVALPEYTAVIEWLPTV